MREVTEELARDGRLLSAAIKAVRKHRGLTTAEVAKAMNMAVRTYERFEAGAIRFNLDYVHRFAAATNSDPYALILAVAVGSPELARRCADNKLGTILTVATQRFDRVQGDRIADLDARTIIAAVTTMFDSLTQSSDAAEDGRQWLKTASDDLLETRPKPGR